MTSENVGKDLLPVSSKAECVRCDDILSTAMRLGTRAGIKGYFLVASTSLSGFKMVILTLTSSHSFADERAAEAFTPYF